MGKRRFSELEFGSKILYILLKIFDVIRYIFSFCLLFASMGIVLYGMTQQKSNFWPESVHFAVPIVVMFALLWILAVLEGFEVVAVEICKNPIREPLKYPRAHKVQQLTARGNNLAKFVLGRQVLVLITVFFLARCTTVLHVEDIFGYSFAKFLATGLMGTVLVVILGQLVPQILAAQYPVHFANFPLMEFVFRCCLFVEQSGIIHAAWIIAPAVGKVLRYQPVKLEENVQKPTLLDKPSNGYALSPVASKESLTLISQVQIEKFADISNFASVGEVAANLTKANLVIPYFLLDTSKASHVPPHVSSLILHAQSLLIQATQSPDPTEKKDLEEQARFYASLALEK